MSGKPIPKAVRDALTEALAWGATYGPAIPGHQWDEMRDKMVEQLGARITAAQQQGQTVVWVSAEEIAPFVGAPQMAAFWGTVVLASGPGDGRTVPLYLTAAQQQERKSFWGGKATKGDTDWTGYD